MTIGYWDDVEDRGVVVTHGIEVPYGTVYANHFGRLKFYYRSKNMRDSYEVHEDEAPAQLKAWILLGGLE